MHAMLTTGAYERRSKSFQPVLPGLNFIALVMVALCDRADHYIFILFLSSFFFLLSSFFLFFLA